MKNKCEKCGEIPPKKLEKGHGIPSSGHCKWCDRIVAPRASNKPMRSKKK